MSCSEATASLESMVMAASRRSVARLAVERAPVAPVAELRAGALRVGRIRQLGEDPPQIGFRFFALTGNRPGFGEAGEIFAAIVLPEAGEDALAQRERGLVVRRGALGELARAVRVGLGSCRREQH